MVGVILFYASILYCRSVRRGIIALLITALCFFTTTFEAYAAVKSGSPCKKLGAISTIKKVNYKCVKERKKLIWRIIKSPIPTANSSPVPTLDSTPTPTQTPTPTPTLSSSPEPFPSPISTISAIELQKVTLKETVFYRLNEGKLERKSDRGSYFDSDSRTEDNFDITRIRAYKTISELPRYKNHPNVEFEWDLRPSFPKIIANYNMQSAIEAAEVFNSYFKYPIKIKSLLATEKDVDYSPAKTQYFSDTYEQLKRIGLLANSPQLWWISGGGGYWNLEGQTYGRLFFGTPSNSEVGNYSPEWLQVSPHEFFHVVQQYLQFGNIREDQPDFNLKIPNHFREGSANFIGYALALKNLGWYSDAMDVSLIRYWSQAKTWKPSRTKEDVVELLLATESRKDPIAFEIGYPLGALFYEWIVAEFGFGKFMELTAELGKQSSFNETTLKVFGVSKLELYNKASSYILTVFNRTINN